MRRLRGLGLCALLLAAVGCVPGSQPAFDGDPLFGGQPRLPRNGAVAAAPRPAANVTGPAQLPSASGSTSPAALAAAVPAADASSLRIPPAPAALASAPHDGGEPWPPAVASAGATLRQPQPLVGPPPRPIGDGAPPLIGGPIAVPVAPPSSPDAYGQLQDELLQRGVLFQKLEGPDDHGVWSFSCGVPKRGDPDADHIVEVSAAGDHGLAAIRAAIAAIDRDAP